MDSDIGGILENLWGGDAQKNSLFCVRLLAVLINGFFYRKYL